MQKLELYIPGLLAAPGRLVEQLTLPDAPALQEWQRRCRVQEGLPGRHGPLRAWLATQHVPLAALAWLGTGEKKRPGGSLFRATPVHLVAGMNDLVLFSGGALDVAMEERARLVRDIAAFLDGAPEFVMLQDQLFLHAAQALDVQTVLLHEAQGMAVRANLPHGRDAPRVHMWMNELQMFLHDHPVNRERAARSLPPINGIWIDGEGPLSASTTLAGVRIFFDSLPMRGLGVIAGGAEQRDDVSAFLPAEGHHVVEYSACVTALDADDVEAWRESIMRINEECLQPVLNWLRQNPSAEAVLHAGDGKLRTLQGGSDGMLQRLSRSFSRNENLRVVEE